LQASGCQAVDLLGVGDLDRPAAGLKRVVDDPRAGHRLDNGADGFSMDLPDPPRERSQRVHVGRDGELVEVRSIIGEQADVELLST
jgi:hypothetical protein